MSDFNPGRDPVTHGDIHETDQDTYDLYRKSNLLQKVLNSVSLVTDPAFYARSLGQAVKKIASIATRAHILDAWTLGNLSYQTARTAIVHRKWIWHLWYIRIPQFYKYAQNWTNTHVRLEAIKRVKGDDAVLKSADSYAAKVYETLLRIDRQDLKSAVAFTTYDYERNRKYITEVLKALQSEVDSTSAANRAYTDSVNAALRKYTDQLAASEHAYTDRKSSDAKRSAVNQANLFTTAAIAALIATEIADLLAQQAEMAAAEAADAAWIAENGAQLENDLGAFGRDLSKFRDVAFIGLMTAYTAFGIEDAKDTGDVTAEVLTPILAPVADSVKALLGVL